MKKIVLIMVLTLIFSAITLYAETNLNVVTTLPDYASFAEIIGGGTYLCEIYR